MVMTISQVIGIEDFELCQINLFLHPHTDKFMGHVKTKYFSQFTRTV